MLRPHYVLMIDEPGSSGSAPAPAPAPESAPASPAPAPAPAPAEEKGLDIAAASKSIGEDLFGKPDPARTEDGKFASTNPPAPVPAPSPAPAAPAASPAPAAPAPAPGQPKPVDLNKAPESWRPEAAKDWAAIPETVRAEIHKREQDTFRGIEQYKGDAHIGRTIKSVVAPILPELQANKLPPEQFLGGLVGMYQRLSDTKQSESARAQFLVELGQRVGIDLSKYQIGETPDASRSPLNPDHPEVKALRDQVQTLQSQITERDQRTANDLKARATQEIETFAKDPANEFFDEVADDIAMLIRGSQGQLTLKDAYERAVRANPTTFAKLTAKLEQAAREKAEKDAKKRADDVRKATNGNVNSRGHSGTENTGAAGSMDDTMRATLDAIRQREARH